MMTPVQELAQALGEENGYQVFAVQPDVMYPAMVEYAQAALADTVAIYGGEIEFKLQAAVLPVEAWALALTNIDEIDREDVRQVREAALELLRRWFTRRLKEHMRQPIGIRILRDDRYRLNR